MTEITDQNIADAGKILAKAALLDPRISAANHAATMAWAELLADLGAGLTADDLLPAVVVHYATSTERILPADVLRIARDRRRDRCERSDEHRAELEARADAKALPDELAERRRNAVAAAAATIGRRHDPDTGDTFDTAPGPANAESQATIAAKVARTRAAAPPQPMPADEIVDAEIYCGVQWEGLDCQLVDGHEGGHRYGSAAAYYRPGMRDSQAAK